MFEQGNILFGVAVGKVHALYARAALRNFESYGGRAKDLEDQTKGLIEEIEKTIHELGHE